VGLATREFEAVLHCFDVGFRWAKQMIAWPVVSGRLALSNLDACGLNQSEGRTVATESPRSTISVRCSHPGVLTPTPCRAERTKA
jgi:hypothetical protein